MDSQLQTDTGPYGVTKQVIASKHIMFLQSVAALIGMKKKKSKC